jgi:hypothetical protein
VDFDVTRQLLVTYCALFKYFRKNGTRMRQVIVYVYTSRRPMIQLEEMSCVMLSLVSL